MIMKKLIILMFIIALASRMSGQSVERYFISPWGGSFYNGSNVAVDYTLGELSISTAAYASNILTQGFQQPFKNNYVSVPEIPDNNVQITISPNPAIDHLNITIKNSSDQSCRVYIYDMLGQLLKDENSAAGVKGNINMDINLLDLPTGNYFIRVIQHNKILTTQKIIKINQ